MGANYGRVRAMIRRSVLTILPVLILSSVLLFKIGSNGGPSANVGAFSKLPAELDGIAGNALNPIESFGLHNNSILRIQLDAEQLMSECMASKGFKYSNPTSVIGSASTDYVTVSQFWRYTTRYGYGISEAAIAASRTHLATTDVNQSYVTSLSRSRRTSYWQALYGQSSPNGKIDGAAIPPTVPSTFGGGCQETAIKQELAKFSLFSPVVGPKIRALAASVASSPTVLTAETQWRTCMAQYGINTTSYDGVRSGIQGKVASTPSSKLGQLLKLEVADASKDEGCFLESIYPAEYRIEITGLKAIVAQYPQYENDLQYTMRPGG